MRPTIRLTLFGLLLVALRPGEIAAQWTTDSLSAGRQQFDSVSAAGRVYFAGGRDMTTLSRRVDIYHPASDTWATVDLFQERSGIAAVAVGQWVLFAGGATSLFNGAATDLIDVLDTQTGLWSTATLPNRRFNAAVVTVGTKALFAGGSSGGPLALEPLLTVDVYDSALGAPDEPAAWTTEVLPSLVARSAIAATTVGDLAIFAGGVIGPGAAGPNGVDTVDIYDGTIDRWTTATLSQARLVGHDAATSSGTRAYFAGGGMPDGSVSDVVDIYDTSTDTWTTETLSQGRALISVVAQNDAVLFAGGQAAGGLSDVVDILDTQTGLWRPTKRLSAPRGDMTSTTLGSKAYFAGGAEAGFVASTVVDVCDSTWVDFGGGTIGVAGQPTLAASGSLVGGSSTTISIADCPPGALMLAWISSAPTSFAALGGTVYAYPFVSQLPLVANGSGALGGSTNWPVGLPPGTQIWFQILVQDGSVVHGITLSNGLRATTP